MVPAVAMASSSGWAWKNATVATSGTLPPSEARPDRGRASTRSGTGSLQRELGRVGQRQLPGDGTVRVASTSLPGGDGEDAGRLERPDLPVTRTPTDHLDELGAVVPVAHVGTELPSRSSDVEARDDDRISAVQSVPRLDPLEVIGGLQGGAAGPSPRRPAHRSSPDAGPRPRPRVPGPDLVSSTLSPAPRGPSGAGARRSRRRRRSPRRRRRSRRS